MKVSDRLPKALLTAAILACIGIGVFGFLYYRGVPLTIEGYRSFRSQLVAGILEPLPGLWKGPLHAWLYHIVFSPHLWLLTALVLLLEGLFPAVSGQPFMFSSLLQDFMWELFRLGVTSFALTWFVACLSGFYARHLSFLTLASIHSLPWGVRIVWAILVSDLLFWIHHWLRHKVEVLWWVHSIHHSQQNMSLWTGARAHPAEYFIVYAISFIPHFALGLNQEQIFVVAALTIWYVAFCHASVRTNMGPLRFILVTPQSHRIHHSIRAEHRDMNFGALFCIWDRLFGTHYPDDWCYPETGTDDDSPKERTLAGVLSLSTLSAQILHPFKQVYRKFILRTKAEIQ